MTSESIQPPSEVEPPYGAIWQKLEKGRAIPFLGAGASLSGRREDCVWNPSDQRLLPSGAELSKCLATFASFPSTQEYELTDLAKVASYCLATSDRETLFNRLHEVLDRKYEFGSLHEFLAQIEAPLLIVTTNYDTLLEQAFISANKPYDLVIHPAGCPDAKAHANSILWWPHGAPKPEFVDPKKWLAPLDKTAVIYKMHGTVHRPIQGGTNASPAYWDNYVITEEDYVEFLSRMTASTAVPACFYTYFRERSFLFLGYSLRDWNLRLVLKNLEKGLRRRDDKDADRICSWSIQYRPTKWDTKLWEKRGVDIYNLRLEDFIERMRNWKKAEHDPR